MYTIILRDYTNKHKKKRFAFNSSQTFAQFMHKRFTFYGIIVIDKPYVKNKLNRNSFKSESKLSSVKKVKNIK